MHFSAFEFTSYDPRPIKIIQRDMIKRMQSNPFVEYSKHDAIKMGRRMIKRIKEEFAKENGWKDTWLGKEFEKYSQETSKDAYEFFLHSWGSVYKIDEDFGDVVKVFPQSEAYSYVEEYGERPFWCVESTPSLLDCDWCEIGGRYQNYIRTKRGRSVNMACMLDVNISKFDRYPYAIIEDGGSFVDFYDNEDDDDLEENGDNRSEDIDEGEKKKQRWDGIVEGTLAHYAHKPSAIITTFDFHA